MQLNGVHHVAITVDDLAEAESFYRSLGCEVLPRPDLGIAGAWLTLGDQQLHLLELADAGPPRVAQHFAVQVPSLDAAVGELRARGIAVDGPFDIAPVGRQAFLHDPSGNQIELHETMHRARHRLAPVGLELLDDAPWRHTSSATVAASAEAVFEAIVASPETWTWFPGVTGGGYVGTPGVGAGRWIQLGRARYEETILEWRAPTRWAFRVDGTSTPVADALVELWEIEARAAGTAVVHWTFAARLRGPLRHGAPLLGPLLDRLFARAMRNLDAQLRSSS